MGTSAPSCWPRKPRVGLSAVIMTTREARCGHWRSMRRKSCSPSIPDIRRITHDDVIAFSSKAFESLLSGHGSLDVVAILAEQDGERLPEVCVVFYQ
jgi:hypothetical protein